MEQFKDWKESRETGEGSVFFHYPKNESEFKKAAKESEGIIVNIYNKNMVIIKRITARVSTEWVSPIFTYVKTMQENGFDLREKYLDSYFFIVPNSYEEKLLEIKESDENTEKIKEEAISLENILKTSKLIAEIYENKNILFSKLNKLDKNEVNKIQNIYKMNKAKDFKVVNLVRNSVAKLLLENQVVSSQVIEDLRNRVRKADTEYFAYLPGEIKENLKNYKTKQGGNPFQAWTDDTKILFPFFYSGETKKLVIKSLEYIAEYVKEKTGMSEYLHDIHTFDGSQNQGSDHLSIAFFPENMKLQDAFQHYIKFYNGEISVGIFKGKNINTTEFENEIKKVFSLKEAVEVFISNKDKIRVLNLKSGDSDKEQEELKNPDNNIKTSNPLNLILYGPPGTGKTYNTINKALEIIIEKEESSDGVDVKKIKELLEKSKNKDLEKEERKILQEAFKIFKEKGQIEFITFHQSYSYEDFVEGIKPDVEKEEMKFKRVDGIFKNICKKADRCKNINPNKNIWKISLGEVGTPDYEHVFNFCIKSSCIMLGFRKDTDYTGKTNDEIQKIYGNLPEKEISPEGYKSIQNIINEVKIEDYVIVPAGLDKIRAIGVVTGKYEFDEKLQHYSQKRKVEWLWWTKEEEKMIVFGDNFFTRKTLYFLKDDRFEKAHKIIKDTLNSQSFVLIIDEINRGNISKIFGELITLIEDDKRLGTENEMTVTLPYSKDSFGVPANLHIVGTMNTADRSIALMDMALRRRFTFEEMMPRTDLLNFKVNGIEIDKLLEKINERIEFLYDRDHTIGHAYFIKLKNNPDYKELCSIFANKIIPLLQEYFYEDWEKIQIVLGDHKDQKNKKKDDDKMVLCDEKSETDVIGFNHPEIDDKRKIYSLNEDLKKGEISPETFIKIYEKIDKQEQSESSI